MSNKSLVWAGVGVAVLGVAGWLIYLLFHKKDDTQPIIISDASPTLHVRKNGSKKTFDQWTNQPHPSELDPPYTVFDGAEVDTDKDGNQSVCAANTSCHIDITFERNIPTIHLAYDPGSKVTLLSDVQTFDTWTGFKSTHMIHPNKNLTIKQVDVTGSNGRSFSGFNHIKISFYVRP